MAGEREPLLGCTRSEGGEEEICTHSRSQPKKRPPILLKFRSSKTLLLWTVCMASFTDIFLYSVIVPVMPFALVSRVGIAEEDVQYWVTVMLASYGATILAVSPICGWISDHSSSHGRPFFFGLLAVFASTVLLCFGTNLKVLLFGRIIQGISAAIVWTSGIALMVHANGQEDIGVAIGWVSLASSLGHLVGPLVGGLLYSAGGYYAVYGAVMGILVGDVGLRVVMIEPKDAERWLRKNEGENEGEERHACRDEEECLVQGDTTSTKTMTPPTLPPEPESDITIVAPSSPQPPATSTTRHASTLGALMRSTRILTALYGTVTSTAILAAFDTVFPLFVKERFDWNSTGAGLIFLPLVLPTFALPLMGRLTNHFHPRWIITTGFTVSVPFLALLALVWYHTVGQIVLLCALLFVIGFTIRLTSAPIFVDLTLAMESMEKADPGLFGKYGAYAQVYGLFNSAVAAGSLLGPVIAGTLMERAGWRVMVCVLAGLSASSAVPAVLFTGGRLIARR